MNDPRNVAASEFWDIEAVAFDQEPDHGLTDPAARKAWRDLLVSVMPGEPADVVDLGCGTGSLSVLLATVGHRVIGIDFSREMLRRAEEKATMAGVDIDFRLGDAADPPLSDIRFDVALARHVVWILSDPDRVLRRWRQLLRPGGRLVMVEGRWREDGGDAVGMRAHQLMHLVSRCFADVAVVDLAQEDALWGRAVDHERYVLTAR